MTDDLALFLKSIRQFKNICNLNLRGNRLSTMSPWLVELSEIEWLDLADNYFTQPPLEVYRLPQLKVLIMSGNPLSQKALDDAKVKLQNAAIWYHWFPR